MVSLWRGRFQAKHFTNIMSNTQNNPPKYVLLLPLSEEKTEVRKVKKLSKFRQLTEDLHHTYYQKDLRWLKKMNNTTRYHLWKVDEKEKKKAKVRI